MFDGNDLYAAIFIKVVVISAHHIVVAIPGAAFKHRTDLLPRTMPRYAHRHANRDRHRHAFAGNPAHSEAPNGGTVAMAALV